MRMRTISGRTELAAGGSGSSDGGADERGAGAAAPGREHVRTPAYPRTALTQKSRLQRPPPLLAPVERVRSWSRGVDGQRDAPREGRHRTAHRSMETPYNAGQKVFVILVLRACCAQGYG